MSSPTTKRTLIENDVLFLNAEARRLGLMPPRSDGFVDTAALFKGWKLGIRKGPKECHRAYAERALSTRAFGLKYSVSVCLDELRIDKTLAKAHDAKGDAYFTHLIFERLRQVVGIEERR